MTHLVQNYLFIVVGKTTIVSMETRLKVENSLFMFSQNKNSLYS